MKSTKNHLNWINSLKGLSMLWIVLFHFHGAYFGWTLTSEYLYELVSGIPIYEVITIIPKLIFSLGYLGVGLFLAISGFGLTYSIISKNKEINWKDWFIRRAKAIYPEYWVALITLTFIPFLIKGKFYVSIGSFISHLLGIQLLFPKWTDSIDGSWWFISFIITFYIAFPLIYKIYKKISLKSFLIYTFIISLVTKICIYYCFHPITDHWYIRFILSRLFEFALGITLATIFYRRIKQKELFKNTLGILIFSIILLISGLILTLNQITYNILAQLILSTAVILLCFTLFSKYKIQIFSELGRIAYPLFLIHFTLIYITQDLLKAIPSFYTKLIIYLTIIFVISTIFYTIMKIIRKKLIKQTMR